MFGSTALSTAATRIGVALAVATLPAQAWAHSAADGHSDGVHGLLHAVVGTEHLLVMAGASLVAALLVGFVLATRLHATGAFAAMKLPHWLYPRRPDSLSATPCPTRKPQQQFPPPLATSRN